MSTFDKLMYGGFGFGPICFPSYILKLVVAIVFPPLAVFLDEMNRGFRDISRIIISIVLTSFFYFPGLLHAISIVMNCRN